MGQRKLAGNVPATPKGPLFTSGGKPGPGRPPGTKGIVQQIREVTNNGQALVEYFWEAMNDPKASRKDRNDAAKWLKEHGFGKAPEITLTGVLGDSEKSVVAASLAEQELEALARKLKPDPAPAPAPVLAVVTAPNPSESQDKSTD